MEEELFTQIHFDFKDWKQCFETMRENSDDNRIRLVISTNPNTSGYWIEDKRYHLGTKDRVVKDFVSLEKRIVKEHKVAEMQQRSPRLVL